MAWHNDIPRAMTPEEKAEIEAAVEGWITQEEKLHLQQLIRELNPEDLDQFNSTIRASLDTIINELDNSLAIPLDVDEDIEIQSGWIYSMEHLKENSDGFLSKLLEIEVVPGIDAMQAFMLTQSTEHIGSELLSIMPDAARENLQILTWSKIVNWIGISSVFRHGANSFFSGFSWILGWEEDFNSETTTSGLSMDSFAEIADSIQNFNSGDVDANGILQIPKELAILNGGSTEIAVPNGIAIWFEYLESLSIGYFTNMKSLLELGKEQWVEDSHDFKNLLAHPQILQSILETWTYSGNGINVDLENKNINLGSISRESIETAGQQIMQDIVTNTNSLSGKVDGILAKTDKFVAIFEKLWINPTEFKEALFNLPVIGFIFKILFGDFLDTIEWRMSTLNEAPEIKKAMETLGKYIEDPENKDKLPFELNQENPGKISDEEIDVLKWFVRKLKNAIPGEWEEKEAQIKSILENQRLARQLLSWEWILETDVFLQKINEGIASLFWGSVKPTQAQFFEKLKSINIDSLLVEGYTINTEEDEDTPIAVDDPNFIWPVQPDIIEDTGLDEDFIWPMQPENTSTQEIDSVDSAVANEINENRDIPSLVEQIQWITWFPASILLEDWTEKSIDYNSSTKTIEIGEDSFTIKEIKRWEANILWPIVTLGNLTFANNIWNLELGVTTPWTYIIDNKDRNGNIMNIPVSSEFMHNILLWLIQNGSHTLTIPTVNNEWETSTTTVVIW